jgi:mono/diheme cytochrome c family protein
LIIGTITGIFSLITGYLLSLDGSNDSDSVNLHKWVAIASVVMFAGYYLFRKHVIHKKTIQTVVLILLLIMITLTGHLGGSLTHGEGYLTAAFDKKDDKPAIASVAKFEKIEDAKLYEDVVLHTITEKCVQCHGANRQKGMLRLDGKERMLKGGKNGEVIDLKNPENSEILKRVLLEMNDEHHMPPKDKNQLSEDELVIMKWWLQTGAEFDKKIALYEKDQKIEKALNTFHQKIKSETKVEVIREKIAPIPTSTLSKLEKSGWVISPLSSTENYVRVVGFNLEVPLNNALDDLKQIKSNIVELKFSFKKISDSNILVLKDFKNLEKLWLDHTLITDKSLKLMNEFQKLTYLNVSYTAVTSNGIEQLNPNTVIKKVYAFNTGIQKNDLISMSKRMPQTSFFTASDSMDVVPSDTLFVKK